MKKIWEKWKSVAEKLGVVQANIVLSVLYYLFIVPIGIFASIFTKPLGMNGKPVWSKYESESNNLEELKDQ